MELWDVRPTAGCDLNQSSTLRNFLSLRQVNAGLKGGGATVFDFSGNAEINVSLEAKKILIDGVVHHPYRYHPLKLPNSFMSILFCYFTWKRQSTFFTLKSKIYLLGRHLLKISIIVSLVEVFIYGPLLGLVLIENQTCLQLQFYYLPLCDPWVAYVCKTLLYIIGESLKCACCVFVAFWVSWNCPPPPPPNNTDIITKNAEEDNKNIW